MFLRITTVIATALVTLSGTVIGKGRPPVRLFLADGSNQVCEFVKYDRTKFSFEFKLGDKKSQLRLSKIRGMVFDTAIQLLPESALLGQSDDICTRSGVIHHLVFSGMDKEKVRIGLDILKTKKEFSVDSLRFIRFNHKILNIDRHDYGSDFNLLDEADVEELASLSDLELKANAELIGDTVIQRYLDSLVWFLAQTAKGQRKQYQIRLINSDEFNAFTVGGGSIYIYRGLFERLATEAELAGVIAHEMGHNIGNHIAQQQSKQLLYAGIIGAAGAILNQDKNEWVKTLTEAGGIVAYFAVMKYGRDEERQADLLGCYNLYTAGIHPRGMVTLFETFSKVSGNSNDILEKWSASHPNPDERRENISAELAELDADGFIETSDRFNWIRQYISSLPPPQYTKKAFQDTTSVAAGAFIYQLLDLTERQGIKNPTLVGQFIASGGSKNDISFHVFDEINFVNWANGNTATTLLSAKDLTMYEVNFKFPKPGNYYLVFDNKDSWVSSKMVIAALVLRYTTR
jgi:Peptidase family M48